MMLRHLTTREKALAASSPAIGVLIVTLVWNAYDRRADIRAWLKL